MEPAMTWRQAAEAFRELLRTERYPVGAEIKGISEICKATGVNRPTAQRAVNYLADQGELMVRTGAMTVVLPPPPAPHKLLNEMDRRMVELDQTAARLRQVIHQYQHERRQQLAQPETKDEAS